MCTPIGRVSLIRELHHRRLMIIYHSTFDHFNSVVFAMLQFSGKKIHGYEGPPSHIRNLVYWNSDQSKVYMRHRPYWAGGCKSPCPIGLISWILVKIFPRTFPPTCFDSAWMLVWILAYCGWALLHVHIFTPLLVWWHYRWFEIPVLIVSCGLFYYCTQGTSPLSPCVVNYTRKLSWPRHRSWRNRDMQLIWFSQ